MEEIRDRAKRAAGGLAASGVTEGGTIAVMLRNDLAFVEAMLAARYLGVYLVPVSWQLKCDELRFLLEDSGAAQLVIHADLLPEARHGIPAHVPVLTVATPPEIRDAYRIPASVGICPADFLEWESLIRSHRPCPDSSLPARRMMYSSGTTGRPKGIKRDPVSPEARDALVDLNRQWFGHRVGMKTAMVGPLYHSVQTSYLASCAPHQRDHCPLSQVRGGDGPAADREREADPPSSRSDHDGPPPEPSRGDEDSPRPVLPRIRDPWRGPCPASVKRRMIEWLGPIVHEYYGTSEAGMVSRCSSEEWLGREGTVGRAWPGRTIRILDDQRNEVPPGVEGDVYMSLGILPDFTYHNDPDGRSAIECDGLITNGDVGYLDTDGYLFLCDRKRDMVISGGTNIYPAEVESVLATHPLVLDCAVLGVPDDEFGEVLAAVIQPRPGTVVSPDELRSFLSPRLAHYKIPRRFALTESLPGHDSGKLFKRVLRDQYWAAADRRI